MSALAGLILGGTGCSSLFNQPTNVEETRRDVEAIRTTQAEMLALVRELQGRLQEQSEAVAALRADSNLEFRELREHLEVLRAQLEEQGVRFDRMQRRSAERPPPSSLADTLGAPAGEPAPGAGPSSSASVYEAARKDFSRGNYQLAVAGFEEYLKVAPESVQADDAQYWIGESYYSLGEMDRAVEELLKVRDLYPDGDMVAKATLKLAYAFLRKEDTATARRYFETVISEFPDSEEADLARDKLDSLE
jgi:tol-pal system protein YbgF